MAGCRAQQLERRALAGRLAALKGAASSIAPLQSARSALKFGDETRIGAFRSDGVAYLLKPQRTPLA